MTGARDDDELAGGSPRDPVRLPPWLQVLGAIAVLSLIGFVVGRAGGHDPGPAPAPRPRPTGVTPTSIDSNPVLTDVTGPLRAPDLCVSTFRNTLTVLFTLENASLSRVTVLQVSARLPIGGLKAADVLLPAKPTCRAVAAAGRRLVLVPGRKVAVALQFRLPPECPAPYPVWADVYLVGRGETPMTQRIPLLNDLGGYDFTSCNG